MVTRQHTFCILVCSVSSFKEGEHASIASGPILGDDGEIRNTMHKQLLSQGSGVGQPEQPSDAREISAEAAALGGEAEADAQSTLLNTSSSQSDKIGVSTAAAVQSHVADLAKYSLEQLQNVRPPYFYFGVKSRKLAVPCQCHC